MRRLLLGLVLAAACAAPAEAPMGADARAARSAHADHASTLTAAQRAAVAQVRAATARFHDLATADAAGYTAQYPAGCARSDAGAQGIHYLNPGLVDATIELLRPELVMYEPGPNGQMQLVGVDYVVPFDAWEGDAAPTLLGMPFMRNEPLGVWALHIWAWRPNPSGMFAMWNPDVSCARAE
ncbi:hypothetical protein [Roseisolibacter sp. H3M3-2]|uniref:hypothetical protein n=1 Tax=Roseisolibacter sp. H3M3-2 TaxID=3031323 RepID=UPI0023DBCDF1|nr:hypothetical protein [Roseisolibacter sp. H3M3-2]MDF1505853.1 hypothetical protein [Roseisolibacter sp. H3M3-2]